MNTLKKIGIVGLAALVLGLGAAKGADARTLHVPSPQYPTIQRAVASSSDSDTIKVASGTYNEDLTLPSIDHLVIQSENGAAFTKIIGTDANYSEVNSAIFIRFHSNFTGQHTIDGFTIEKPSPGGNRVGYGLIADYGAYSTVVVKNCIIQNCKTTGLYFCSQNFVIENNIIQNNGQGIFTCLSSGTIKGNLIANSGNDKPGIYSLTNTATYISNNTIVKNKKGGLFTDTNARYDHNIVANNNEFGILVANANCDNGCNDAYGNDKDFVNTALTQIAAPNASDIQANPYFCDPSQNNYTINTNSPILKSSCWPIGALGTGCSFSPAKPLTWGKLKNVYK